MVTFEPSPSQVASSSPAPPAGNTRPDRHWGRWVVAALVLWALLVVGGLVVVYYGDEVAQPAWSEESVPAPRLY